MTLRRCSKRSTRKSMQRSLQPSRNGTKILWLPLKSADEGDFFLTRAAMAEKKERDVAC